MLLRVEVHPGLLLRGGLLRYRHPIAATCSSGGLDEYQPVPPYCRPRAVPAKAEKIHLGGGPRRHGMDAPSESQCKERRALTEMKGGRMMQVTRIGLDIAKNVFQVHGVDIHGAVVVRKQ